MKNLNTKEVREKINILALSLYNKEMKDLKESQKSTVVLEYLKKGGK